MAFEFYSSFCKCATRKRKIRRKKNEETEPMFEVAYLGNAQSDFAQIWNMEYCSWRACPQQKLSCFIKEAQSYGGAKICIFFLPVNILTGVTRRLLGPHDTLPCVLMLVNIKFPLHRRGKKIVNLNK